MTVKPGWARKRPRIRRREANVAPADTAGSPWPLPAEEWRTLAITFVGGLGSIIAAACVIAGAIALDRWIAHNNHGHINWGDEALSSGFLVLAGGFSLYLLRPDLSKRWAWFGTVVYGLLLAIVLLVWVGLAAGVH